MKIARAIANKLNSLTKQKPAPSQAMGAAGGTGLKSAAVSTGPQYIDLMLIVDSSGSIGTRPFEDIKDATEVFIYLSIYFFNYLFSINMHGCCFLIQKGHTNSIQMCSGSVFVKIFHFNFPYFINTRNKDAHSNSCPSKSL